MPKCTIHGAVEGGRFVADFPSVFRNALTQYEGKRVSITVDIFKRPRSLQQNKFLQGVVYPMIADESEQTQKEVALAMKSRFLTPRFVLDTPIVGTTTVLSTVELNEYVERIRVWALDFLGITIPVPRSGIDYEP